MKMPGNWALKSAVLAGVAAVALGTGMAGASAQPAPVPAEEFDADERLGIWDLPIGGTIADMPALIEFKGYACGSDGGPQLRPLPNGWADFMLCTPEADGLREVYFEYDDELEFIMRAAQDPRVARYVGTQDKSFPVMTSALFSEDGVLRGIRVVSDPRPDYSTDDFFDLTSLRPREEHYIYFAFVAPDIGIDPLADCVGIPLSEGENPVGGIWVKNHCEHVDTETGFFSIADQHYYRKPGQQARNPITGRMTINEFESTTKAEKYMIGYGPAPTLETGGAAPAPSTPVTPEAPPAAVAPASP